MLNVAPFDGSQPGFKGGSRTFRGAAFTLIEMVVAIGILVVVILAVGVIFKSAARAVGISQSSMEMQSGVRSIQRQIESDVAGIDKTAFLVIRCATVNDATTIPNTVRRCDQIAFISTGTFPNHSGTDSGFTDNLTTAPSALVWWGQPAMEQAGGSNGSPTDPTVSLNSAATTIKLPLNQVPTSLIDPNTNILREDNFNLGRFTMLLVPASSGSNNVSPNGQSLYSFPGTSTMAAIDYNNPNEVQGITSEGQNDITQSRVDVAQGTTSQIMSIVRQAINGSRTSNPRYEADRFCYRHAALRSPYDGAGGSLVNGYFRMTPIALQGVSSFAIDWTDGSVYTGSEIDVTTGKPIKSTLVGTTKWFGAGPDGTTGNGWGIAYQVGMVDPYGITGAVSNGDSYAAVFSFDNPTKWPVALRFRYHVADPTGRLVGGRDFVEVVKLPR